MLPDRSGESTKMTRRILLTNASFYCGDEVVTGQALSISGTQIDGFVPLTTASHMGEVYDLAGLIVAPGFIDLQINGGGDILWNDSPTPDAARIIWKAHLRSGTTNLLPTFITGSAYLMEQAATSINYLLDEGDTGVLGIHFEGPWIEPVKAGVHDIKYIRQQSAQDEVIYRKVLPHPTLVTLAPERVPAGTISRLFQCGIRVAAGHTNATFGQMLEAIKEGLSGVTHLHNAMSPMTSREPGAVGATLANDGLKAGIIVDGHHVHYSVVATSWRSKCTGDLFLVSDAMPPVGGSRSNFRIGPREITCVNGRCQTASGNLAGAALDMATAVRNCVEKVGIPITEALRMASLYPARFLGVDDKYGYIRAGYRANLVMLDGDLAVSRVMFNGRFVCD
jgi:N-acetylglucosamine-6-phosphate deacetylase